MVYTVLSRGGIRRRHSNDLIPRTGDGERLEKHSQRALVHKGPRGSFNDPSPDPLQVVAESEDR
jgi:hypothetical protein